MSEENLPKALTHSVPRRGLWSLEEERYAEKIICNFENGTLDVPKNTTLRMYLATVLNCDPMRISKKYSGSWRVRRRYFAPLTYSAENALFIDTSRRDLAELRCIWINKLLLLETRDDSRKKGVEGWAWEQQDVNGFQTGLVAGSSATKTIATDLENEAGKGQAGEEGVNVAGASADSDVDGVDGSNSSSSSSSSGTINKRGNAEATTAPLTSNAPPTAAPTAAGAGDVTGTRDRYVLEQAVGKQLYIVRQALLHDPDELPHWAAYFESFSQRAASKQPPGPEPAAPPPKPRAPHQPRAPKQPAAAAVSTDAATAPASGNEAGCEADAAARVASAVAKLSAFSIAAATAAADAMNAEALAVDSSDSECEAPQHNPPTAVPTAEGNAAGGAGATGAVVDESGNKRSKRAKVQAAWQASTTTTVGTESAKDTTHNTKRVRKA